MAEKSKIPLPPELRAAAARFNRWRARRPPGRRTRIPETLWAAAVRAARTCSVHRAARALALSHTALAERCRAAASSPLKPGRFVELAPSAPADARECVVEIEPPGGGRARIRVAGVTAHEVAAIAAALLKTAR